MEDSFDIMDFRDCTPLVNDVEWDERLEALEASLKEKNAQNQQVVPVGNSHIDANNLLAMVPNDDRVEPAPQADTSESSTQQANLAALAKVCETKSTRPLNFATALEARESDSDQLADLAIVAVASASKLTHPANPPKRRRINRKDFQLPYGWIEVPVVRKGGKSAGQVDQYYLEPSTGKRCRSRVQLHDYISLRRTNELNTIYTTTSFNLEHLAAYKADGEREEAPSSASFPSSTQWIPPQPGFYKVNFDAAIFADLGCIGIGVVIRDHCGEFFAALSQKIVGPFDASTAETMAAKVAIKFALDSGFWDVHLEGEAQNVMGSLRKQQGANFPVVGGIIESAQNQLIHFRSYVLSWTRPDCNSVADCLATYAREVDDIVIWLEDVPSFVCLDIVS